MSAAPTQLSYVIFHVLCTIPRPHYTTNSISLSLHPPSPFSHYHLNPGHPPAHALSSPPRALAACVDYKASDPVVSYILLALSLTLPVAIVQVNLAFLRIFTHKASSTYMYYMLPSTVIVMLLTRGLLSWGV